MPVKPTAYPVDPKSRERIPVPEAYGHKMPLHHPYYYDKKEMFEPFRDVDKIRLLKRRLAHFVSLERLFCYGILKTSYVSHKYHQIKELEAPQANFARIKDWWKPMTDDFTQARDYLGEEATLFFFYFRFFTMQMIIPAIFAVLTLTAVWLERNYQFIGYGGRVIQDCFALFVAIWAAQFCEAYR